MNTLKPRIIISGGQSGADIAALEWAKARGWKTGGIMPYGYRTEFGSKPEYKDLYGMFITKEYADYKHRTLLNVKNSDYTIIFGKSYSPGTKHTIACASKSKKPYIAIDPYEKQYNMAISAEKLKLDNDFLCAMIVNVAGNRETVSPGIGTLLKQLLDKVFE